MSELEKVRKEITLSNGQKIITHVNVFSIEIDGNKFVFQKEITYGKNNNLRIQQLLFPIYDPLQKVPNKEEDDKRKKELITKITQSKEYRTELRKLISYMSYNPELTIEDLDNFPDAWITEMSTIVIENYMEGLIPPETSKKKACDTKLN